MQNRMYSPLLNPLVEGINLDDYCVATYLIGAEKNEDPITKANSIGIEQTTGSWIDVAAETDEVRALYCSKVLAIYEVPDYENFTNMSKELADKDMRFYVIRIAYPQINIEDNLPLLFATITGNIMSMPYLRLLDIDFPAKFVAKFKGPKFGIQGIRDILGVKNRPLLNNMIKPCTGYTPEVGAQLFYDAALGGVDIIKDDELISGDRAFNKLEDRVKMNMAAAAKADKIKGETTMYTVNITDEVHKLKDNAMRAIKAGTNAIMVDAFGIGLSALRSLAEDPDVNVPILAHTCYGGALKTSPYQGVSSIVLYKMMRMCGADIILIECPYGKFDNLQSKYVRSIQICQSKFYNIKTSLPFIGGGVIPGLIPTIMKDTGNDVLLGCGASVHGFPTGPVDGAKALRQAIDACMAGVSLREAAKTHKELEIGLKKWGVYGEENLKELYAI